MNINILLEALYNTEIKNKTFSGVGNRKAVRLGGRRTTQSIGMGTRSGVALDKTDPHMVRKYNHDVASEDGADGFGKFAEWVTANDIENRYLPRVYKIQKGKNPKTGYVAYTYRMERLIPLRDISDDESIALLSTFIDINKLYNKYVDGRIKDASYADVKRNYEILMYYALKYIDAIVVGRDADSSFITDDELLTAIGILQKYVKDNFNGNFNAAGADLHDGNFMARRTQHGLQLVISDPFW